jgi:hypothetical protein
LRKVASFSLLNVFYILQDLRKQLKTTEGPVLKEELKVTLSSGLAALTSAQSMRRVLRKLGHSSSEGVLLPKVRTPTSLLYSPTYGRLFRRVELPLTSKLGTNSC